MSLTRRSAIGVLAGSVVAPALNGFATASAPVVDAVLAKVMAGKAVPGMTALIIRDFIAGPEGVAGICALGNSKPLAAGSLWHIGSNGKAITATLIARLVQAGVLRWDRPLSQMLPQLAENMHASYRDATLPDLLSHRAGLPENTSDMKFFATFYDNVAPLAAQRLRYVSSCLKETPIGPARASPAYSNTGPLIAAVCAEHATGQPFEALITAEVFKPLGMGSISFNQFGGAGEPSGHIDGRLANRPKDANPRMFAPAGAMRMTMGDWARFCIDQLQGENGRGRLLAQETYRFLHGPQGGSPEGAGWALGWGAAPHPMNLNGPALTHSGSDGNWYALVCLFPQTGNGVLVVSNAGQSMGGDQAASEAMRALAQTVAKPFGPPKP